MDWTIWLAIAVMIGSLVGMWLYAKAWHRNPSEYEKAYAELHRATKEARDAIAKELRPVVMKAADATLALATAFKKLDGK